MSASLPPRPGIDVFFNDRGRIAIQQTFLQDCAADEVGGDLVEIEPMMVPELIEMLQAVLDEHLEDAAEQSQSASK